MSKEVHRYSRANQAQRQAIAALPTRNYEMEGSSQRSGLATHAVNEVAVRLNNQPASRAVVEKRINKMKKSVDFDYGPTSLSHLGYLLERVHPGCGRVPWLKALRAVHHETSGSEEGFELANQWSSKGQNYRGKADVRKHWRSIKPAKRPVTGATLIWMERLMRKLYGPSA